ncbi:MAG TPA: hypothetical protein VFR17_09175 [Mycobacterium sp.]|nr:hypothetical protein [Mycobacterium sp.]
MSRQITKVFCVRNHRIGTVCADADGLFIDYTAEVHHRGGIFGARTTDRLSDDEVCALTGYCASCKQPVALDSRTLRRSALSGERDVHAPSADAADATWRQAGREPLYPHDVTRHKTDPPR